MSNAAKTCLQAKSGRKRSLVPVPTEVPRAPVKPESLQSTLERRLRRTYRRVLELQKPFWPWTLLNKVRAQIHKLTKTFPELSDSVNLMFCPLNLLMPFFNALSVRVMLLLTEGWRGET